MVRKNVMLTLSCGHTITLTPREAASSTGNHVSCPKCPLRSPDRRVVERAMVSPFKSHE